MKNLKLEKFGTREMSAEEMCNRCGGEPISVLTFGVIMGCSLLVGGAMGFVVGWRAASPVSKYGYFSPDPSSITRKG